MPEFGVDYCILIYTHCKELMKQWVVMAACHCNSWGGWWSDTLWDSLTRLMTALIVMLLSKCCFGDFSAISYIHRSTWSVYCGGQQLESFNIDMKNCIHFLFCRVWSTCTMTVCHRLCTGMWNQTTYFLMLTTRHMLLTLGLLEFLKPRPSQHGGENPCQRLQAPMVTLLLVNFLWKNVLPSLTMSLCIFFISSCSLCTLELCISITSFGWWIDRINSKLTNFGSWINVMNKLQAMILMNSIFELTCFGWWHMECCRVCLYLKHWWEERHLQLWCCVAGAHHREETNWGHVWRRCWSGEVGDGQNPEHWGAIWSIWHKTGACSTWWHDPDVESCSAVLVPAPKQPAINAWGGAVACRSWTQKLWGKVKLQK